MTQRAGRIVFASPSCTVTIDGRGYAIVRGLTPRPWQPAPIETGAFLDRLAAVRCDDAWQDQAAVHAFLREEINGG